ncbi:glycoside hydrolase family 3 protein [Streptomyces sp. NBC_00237]|uniref:glycoside hydrolase family 3 protein n=1 Tax=Streptomyces sp. NBC_00237 TaxID=2975687 RepID=UPI002251CAF2|nr:glycoside hydrolase family 3 N-terminal domain-containing protein [Streptomyces sp. NBC_00237]MCX5203520.1 glycoside hydrolase family 3 protein [Streptomyces sp. NBC_00237]
MDSSLTPLVNACLLPAYDGRTPPDWVKRALDQGLAGVGLFGTNLLPPGGPLRDDIVDPLRAVRPDALIALDEEGGDVTRLDYHRGSVYPGNHALGAVDDPDLTRQVAEAIADDLLDTGVNLCLGPCADVNSRPGNPIIGVRSFGATPDLVARHTRAFVTGLQGRGVAATLKHFPGHGDTGTDSHSWLPDIPRSLDELRALELPPFVEGFDAGAKAVMTGHIRIPQVDDLPATLSRRVVTGLLREELGYDGVVISDALEMAPILDRWGFGGAAVLAWAAGVDLVLLGATDGEKILPEVYEAVERALRRGELTVDRLEEAAARVAALRAWAAPKPAAPVPTPGPVPAPGFTAGVGLAAARRALSGVALPELPAPAPVHVLRLAVGANLAVGEAPWGLAQSLERLGRLASATDVEPGTDPHGIALPESPGAEGASAPLVVVVRDAAHDPWQQATLAALRARRPGLLTVEMGLTPVPLPEAPTLLTRGAGLANATAAAELLTGRPWTAPLRT